MSQKHHPWRDIYSNRAWEKILQLTSCSRDPQLAPLTQSIKEYNALPKDEATGIAFSNRQSKLVEVGEAAGKYLATSGVSTDKGGKHKFTPDESTLEHVAATTGTLMDRIGPWVESLRKRCAKKREYLETMKGYYETNGWRDSRESSPEAFLRYLNKVQQGRNTDKKMHLTPQNRLERIDPYHRSAEFSLKDMGDSWLIEHSELPMSIALCEWLTDPKAADKPFFVWLENHPICTTTPGLDEAYRGEYADRIRMTKYEKPTQEVYVQGNCLFTRTIGETDGQPLHTLDGGGKAFPGAYAFVWTTGGSIYSAKHGLPKVGKRQPIHHSTFTLGRKVRCAGMWQVDQGKVKLLDNNTGHYRTDIRRLYRFVLHLQKQGVFAADARIEDVVGLASRGGMRSIEDWLAAAKRFLEAKPDPRPIVKPGAERVGREKVAKEVPKKFTIPAGKFVK